MLATLLLATAAARATAFVPTARAAPRLVAHRLAPGPECYLAVPSVQGAAALLRGMEDQLGSPLGTALAGLVYRGDADAAPAPGLDGVRIIREASDGTLHADGAPCGHAYDVGASNSADVLQALLSSSDASGTVLLRPRDDWEGLAQVLGLLVGAGLAQALVVVASTPAQVFETSVLLQASAGGGASLVIGGGAADPPAPPTALLLPLDAAVWDAALALR